MPSSDEMFGTTDAKGQMPEQLPFPGVESRNYGFEPDADEFEKKMEAIKYNKLVKLIDYNVKTFRLNDKGAIEAYRALYRDLYNKCAGGSVVIHVFDRQFVEHADIPYYLVHLEWSEFEFTKEDLHSGKVESSKDTVSRTPEEVKAPKSDSEKLADKIEADRKKRDDKEEASIVDTMKKTDEV